MSDAPAKRLDRVWTVLRIMAKRAAADVPMIMIAARSGERDTRRYLQLLERAGYLRREGALDEPHYRLIRDTGPARPHRCFDVMQDGNTATPYRIRLAEKRKRINDFIAANPKVAPAPVITQPTSMERRKASDARVDAFLAAEEMRLAS